MKHDSQTGESNVKKTSTVREMASAPVSEESIYLHESVIRGHHIFKQIWTPRIGEILSAQQETENVIDRKAVALLKADGTVVGHVPREHSKAFWYFIAHGGRVSCEVTGRRKYGKGLEVPCVYKLLASEVLIVKLNKIIQKSTK